MEFTVYGEGGHGSSIAEETASEKVKLETRYRLPSNNLNVVSKFYIFLK